MFTLGNFSVEEIICGVAQQFTSNGDGTGEILYVLDQLTNSQIEVSSDPTEVTDKKGNVINTIYKSKSATYTASSAMISPVLLNANSGSDMKIASSSSPITDVPKIISVSAGGDYSLPSGADFDTAEGDGIATLKVIGMYNNGANGEVMTLANAADLATNKFGYTAATTSENPVPAKITMPAKDSDGNGADYYIVIHRRSITDGYAMKNTTDSFPSKIALTLYAAIADPCSDVYKAAYIFIPSFQPDPSVTINFDSESQEMDYNGNLNVSYCSSEKLLYHIYFPDEEAVTSGTVA